MSIKICVISPASCLEYSKLGDCEMALSHLIVNDMGFENTKLPNAKQIYIDYYKAQAAAGKWVILDNSAYEIGKLEATSASGEGLGPKLVIEAARIIKPSIVIAQDVLTNREATFEATKKFIQYVKDEGLLGTFQIMAVAQGKTEEEWLASFEELSNLPEIDQIGLSKISVPLSFGGSQATDGCVSEARLRCTDAIAAKFPNFNKKVHLLGGDNRLPWELQQQTKHEFVFSNDSSASVWYGMSNKKYEIDGTIGSIITKKPDLENDEEKTELFGQVCISAILHNILTLHKMSKGS